MFSLRSLTATALLAGVALAQDCVLTVPPNPLTAAGLATPYTVTGCDQRTLDTSSFVECAIFDGSAISIYHPLVVNAGDVVGTDFVKPVPATVPAGSTTACWFGSNGNTLTLTGDSGGCVNGLGGSIFGQFATCNGATFMKTAIAAGQSGALAIPALGTGTGGQCPSTRDFRIVDQDQSDNVITTYLLNGNVLSQNTPANNKAADNATILTNGSDNALVAEFVDPALGCKPFMAPSVTAPSGFSAALSLNELAANKEPPVSGPPALVPINDPMVVIGANSSVEKVNLYRAAVGQPLATNVAGASSLAYCKNILIGGIFTQDNQALFAGKSSPLPAVANNLYTFLAQRFATSLSATGGLNCLGLLNFAQPVAEAVDGNGIVTSASINVAPLSSLLAATTFASGTVAVPNASSTANSAIVNTDTSIGIFPSHHTYFSKPAGLSNAGIATTTDGASAATSVSAVAAGNTATSPTAAAATSQVTSGSSAASAVAQVSSLMSSYLSSVASGLSVNASSSLPITPASSASAKAGKGGKKATPTTLITAVGKAVVSTVAGTAASSSNVTAAAVSVTSASAPAALVSASACSLSKNAQGLVFDGTTAYFPIPSEFAQFLEGAL